MARFYRQISAGIGKRIEDPHVTVEVLTIIRGPHRAGDSRRALHLRHSWRKHISTQQEILKEVLWTLFSQRRNQMGAPPPYWRFVITVRMANSNIHRMLVDNGSVVNILYWDAYQNTGPTEIDLSSTTFPLYRFTRDHMIPRGTI